MKNKIEDVVIGGTIEIAIQAFEIASLSLKIGILLPLAIIMAIVLFLGVFMSFMLIIMSKDWVSLWAFSVALIVLIKYSVSIDWDCYEPFFTKDINETSGQEKNQIVNRFE